MEKMKLSLHNKDYLFIIRIRKKDSPKQYVRCLWHFITHFDNNAKNIYIKIKILTQLNSFDKNDIYLKY